MGSLGVTQLLTMRPILAHLHILDAEGFLPLTLERSSTEPQVVRVPLLAGCDKQTNFREVHGVPTPIFASEPDNKYYWQCFLDDSRTLFIP